MTFQTEFPDFSPDTMPTFPEGWTDSSWHNDSCPSFTAPDKSMLVFVDYLPKALREVQTYPRFVVLRLDNGQMTDRCLIDSDSWDEILAFITKPTAAPTKTVWFLADEASEGVDFFLWAEGPEAEAQARVSVDRVREDMPDERFVLARIDVPLDCRITRCPEFADATIVEEVGPS